MVEAGAREPVSWGVYSRCNAGLPNADLLEVELHFLHSAGLLDCTAAKGWTPRGGCHARDLVEKSGRKACCRPVDDGSGPVAECLHLVTPRHVLEAVSA